MDRSATDTTDATNCSTIPVDPRTAMAHALVEGLTYEQAVALRNAAQEHIDALDAEAEYFN